MKHTRRRAVALLTLMLVSMSLIADGGAIAGPPSVHLAQEGEPTASIPEWPNLPYLRYSNGWFRILSNHQKFGGTEITSSTPITPNNPDPTPEEYDGIDLEALWAGRCLAVDEQTMKKSRKVYFPGKPATLQISQWAYGSTGKHPIRSIAVKVNGSVVHKVNGADVQTPSNRTVIDLPNSARESFRYGLNTVSLVAIKRETRKSAGYCSTKKFGAAFELAGTFRADVSSTIPHGQATLNAAFMPMTITNNGPSHLPAGTYPCDTGSCGYPTMHLWAVSETAEITGIAGFDGGTVDSPLREDCRSYTYIAGPREGFMLNCGLPAIAPGESVTIGIGLTYEATPESIIYFGYGAPGYAETVESNTNNGESDREITGEQT